MIDIHQESASGVVCVRLKKTYGVAFCRLLQPVHHVLLCEERRILMTVIGLRTHA